MSSPTPPEFPALWATPAPPARKRGLSVGRVVEAAIALADAEGIEAVSMARVAERLGFSTMSLYRHVRGKDELLALMVDAGVEYEPAAVSGWRDGLERWALDFLAMVRRHPWIVRIEIVRQPMGPNRAAWLDSGLQALAGTALREDDKMGVMLMLNGYVFGEAQIDEQVRSAERDGIDPGTSMLAILDAPGAQDRFPALRHALTHEGLGPAGVEEDHFAFGLERVLDGIAVLVERRAAEPAATGR